MGTLITAALMVLVIILINLSSLLFKMPIINEVSQAKVKITGYQDDGTNGIVICETTNGNIVHLIDLKKSLQLKCVNCGGHMVSIKFRLKVSWYLLYRIDIYIVDIEF